MSDCFPVEVVGSEKFMSVGTAPGCKDGWGWLKDGECGCAPGSPGYKQGAGGMGCSVRCTASGPVQCGMWCALPDGYKYAIYGVFGIAAVWLLGRALRPSKALNGMDDVLGAMHMLPASKRKKRKSKRKSKK